MQLALLVLQIVLQLLNIALIIYKKWDKWNEEQRALMMKRFQSTLETLQLIVKSAHDSFNEEAFLKLQSDETQLRYKLYYGLILDELKDGYGITELSAHTDAGMGVRVRAHKPEVLRILTLILSPEEKARQIAAAII